MVLERAQVTRRWFGAGEPPSATLPLAPRLRQWTARETGLRRVSTGAVIQCRFSRLKAAVTRFQFDVKKEVGMALEMGLELSGAAEDWRKLRFILNEIGLSAVEERGELSLRGVLGHGELIVGASWGNAPRGGVIRAEGNHGCDFVVHGNLTFRIINALYDEAVETIKTVLIGLTERTDMQFVLSFQYEEVRAIRDRERGFEWFWNEAR
jgi:hypothetical protein